MIEKIITSSKYKDLEVHIKKLLKKAENGFKKNANDFILFQIYLLATDNYKKSIWEVDSSLQLLLSNPQQFWFCNTLNNSDQNNNELKRNVIKYILLKDLELYLVNNSKIYDKNTKLAAFIRTQTEELNNKLNNENLLKIFDHNMDFTLPRSNMISNYITMIPPLAFMTASAFLSMAGSYHCGWGYINKVLNYNNVDYYDLPWKDQKAAWSLLLYLSLLTGFTVSRISYRFFNNSMPSIKGKSTADWQKISCSEVISECSQQTDITLNSRTSQIDPFWFYKSHLSELEGKGPILFRTYMHLELQRLFDEMEEPLEFCKLLTCCVLQVPGNLKDIPYSLPIETLRDPQSGWTANTAFSKKDCHALLQNYSKLAIIDFLNEILSQKNILDNSKYQVLNKLLAAKSKELQELIIVINRKDLDNTKKAKAISHLNKESLTLLICVLGHIGIFHYQIANLTEVNGELGHTSSSLERILMFLAKLFTTPGGGSAAAVIIYKLIHTTQNVYSNYQENKNVTSMKFFTQKTLKAHPELEDVFANNSKKMN